MEIVKACENCRYCCDFGVFGCYCELNKDIALNVGLDCNCFEQKQDDENDDNFINRQ